VTKKCPISRPSPNGRGDEDEGTAG